VEVCKKLRKYSKDFQQPKFNMLRFRLSVAGSHSKIKEASHQRPLFWPTSETDLAGRLLQSHENHIGMPGANDFLDADFGPRTVSDLPGVRATSK
jgi:hypothetical protein